MRSIVIAGLLCFGAAAAWLRSSALAIVTLLVGIAVAVRRPRDAKVLVILATLYGCAPAVSTKPALQNVPMPTLAFKGRLAGDARHGLPSSIAAALDPRSDVVFTYDERITQSHDELPFAVMMLTSTFHLLGVPTGRDEVTAHADLAVTRGEHEIQRYRGEATASQIYGLYYGASMLALEDEARAAVRRVIDEALAHDVRRLGARLDGAPRD